MNKYIYIPMYETWRLEPYRQLVSTWRSKEAYTDWLSAQKAIIDQGYVRSDAFTWKKKTSSNSSRNNIAFIATHVIVD